MISVTRSSRRIPNLVPTLRITIPIARHHKKFGKLTGACSTHFAITVPTTTHTSAAANEVITATESTLFAKSALSAYAELLLTFDALDGTDTAFALRVCFRMSRSATGPPIMPPNTNPNVAAVIANTITSCMLFTSAKRVAYAAPVPCPPTKVIVPPIKPISGCMSNSLAIPNPITFCSTRNGTSANRKAARRGPPAASNFKFAVKPIQLKNSSNKVSFLYC